MFKLTGTSGRRSASGGSRAARVSATRMGYATPLATQVLRVPAFQPDLPQEHGFDASSPRLSGLEK